MFLHCLQCSIDIGEEGCLEDIMTGLEALPKDNLEESEEMLLDILDKSDRTDSSIDSIEEGKSSSDSDGLCKNPLNNDVHGYRYPLSRSCYFLTISPVVINIV